MSWIAPGSDRQALMSQLPGIGDRFQALYASFWRLPQLPATTLELCRLRSAQHVGCVLCKAVRYDIAIEAGLDEDKVQLIGDGFETSALSPREKLILAFTDQYLNNPAVPPAPLRQQLQAEFSPQELLHLSLVVAYFNGFSRCAVGLGGMPDHVPRMEISVPR